MCLLFALHITGQEAPDEDSSDSEAEDQGTLSQDTKLQDSQSQQGSASHRPRSSSGRAVATWSADSSSDDSRRWSDQLSLDEKEGFIFVNYSEGQAKGYPQAPANHPRPNPGELRHYSKLKPGGERLFSLVPRKESVLLVMCCSRSLTASILKAAILKDASRLSRHVET